MSDFAIVIGVRHYPYLQEDLPSAHRDAIRFKRWLVNVAGLPNPKKEPDEARHIELILSRVHNNDPTPVKTQIDRAFRRIFDFAEKEGGSRRLYIYFAGHGSSASQHHVALLLADATLKELNNSLNGQAYHEGLSQQILFPEQVMFYDCCRNHDGRNIGQPPPWSQMTDEEIAAQKSALAQIKQYIFFAAGFTQYSNTMEPVLSRQRGFFTKALLEGLHGAEPDKDGNVTIVSLDRYIKERMKTMLEPIGIDQQPRLLSGDSSEDLVLVGGINATRTWVVVRVPPTTRSLTVFNENYDELRKLPVVDGVVEIPLYPGLYNFEIEPKPYRSRGQASRKVPAALEWQFAFPGVQA
ncbi:MAG: caspase family protein [Armatimonas sp.]